MAPACTTMGNRHHANWPAGTQIDRTAKRCADRQAGRKPVSLSLLHLTQVGGPPAHHLPLPCALSAQGIQERGRHTGTKWTLGANQVVCMHSEELTACLCCRCLVATWYRDALLLRSTSSGTGRLLEMSSRASPLVMWLAVWALSSGTPAFVLGPSCTHPTSASRCLISAVC